MPDDKPTQKSQPQKPDVEPIDIPIPTREQIFGDLAKTARPIVEHSDKDSPRDARVPLPGDSAIRRVVERVSKPRRRRPKK